MCIYREEEIQQIIKKTSIVLIVSEFWAFVGRTFKGNRKVIVSLKRSSGSSAISTKGKIEVLQKHYELARLVVLQSEDEKAISLTIEREDKLRPQMFTTCAICASGERPPSMGPDPPHLEIRAHTLR